MRAGYISPAGNEFDGVGYEGNFWTNTASSQNYEALNLRIYGVEQMHPAIRNYRYLGRSVRCVAR